MAAPNIVNLTALTGKTDVLALGTTAAAIVTNAAGSGQLFKVNTLLAANIDGTDPAEVTVELLRGGIAYRVASTITVPADASLVVLSKDIGLYLEEGDSLRCSANAAGVLQAICSYEIIAEL